MILHQPVHAHDHSGPHIGQLKSKLHVYISEHCSQSSSGQMSQVSMSMLQLQPGYSASTTPQPRILSPSRCINGTALARCSFFGPRVTNSSSAFWLPRRTIASLNILL